MTLEQYIEVRLQSLRDHLVEPQGSIWRWDTVAEVKARIGELTNLLNVIRDSPSIDK